MITPQINEHLDEIAYESKSTRVIQTLKLPAKLKRKFVTFDHDSCLITKEKCQEKVNIELSRFNQNNIESKVKVRILKLDWMFKKR